MSPFVIGVQTMVIPNNTGTVEKHSLNLFDFGIKRQDCSPAS